MVALSAAAALVLGAALIVLIVAVTGQRDAARTAFRSQEALSVADQLEKSLLSVESGLNRYVATKRPSFLVRVRRELALYPSRTQRLAALVSDDPGQQSRVRALAVQVKDYDDFWVQSLIEIASQTDRFGESTGFVKARSQIETDGGRSRLDAIRTRFARLFDRERAVIRAREDKAESRSSRAIGFGLGGLGLLVAVSAGFTLYLRRSVLRPVRTVAEATGRLAAGDLTTRVPAQREDELGELARGFNTMADSLERGREELERSNAELSRSNAELEQFASVTSHDLQAPLTTITMYAELLDRRRSGSAGNGDRDLVDGIRDATQQARGLIRDLLEYSRAGRGRLALEQVSAGRIVDQALEALAGTIEETGAQITVGDLPVVLADRANLSRVFQNLVGNAVKFTGEETPRVSIDAEHEDGHWRFSVSDNGIGMDSKNVERIFEPFQRLHGEEAYPGTGIGLAVCERIVDQHGGRIWVSSRLGGGSVFHFTLPAALPAGIDPAPVRAGV